MKKSSGEIKYKFVSAKKRLLSLVSLVLVVGVLAGGCVLLLDNSTEAADGEITIYQDGRVINPDGSEYDQEASDQLLWDAATNTLTLNNYDSYAIVIENGGEPVNLVLSGENVLRSFHRIGREERSAIFSAESEVSISGTGSLAYPTGSYGELSYCDYYMIAALGVDLDEDFSGEILGSIYAGFFTMNAGTVVGDLLASEFVMNGGQFFGRTRLYDSDDLATQPTFIMNDGEINALFMEFGHGDDVTGKIEINGGTINTLGIGYPHGSIDDGMNQMVVSGGEVNALKLQYGMTKIVDGKINVDETVKEILKEKFIDSGKFEYYYSWSGPSNTEEGFIEEIDDQECTGFDAKVFSMARGEVKTCQLILNEGSGTFELKDGELDVEGAIVASYFRQEGGKLKVVSQMSEQSPGVGMEAKIAVFDGGVTEIYGDLFGLFGPYEDLGEDMIYIVFNGGDVTLKAGENGCPFASQINIEADDPRSEKFPETYKMVIMDEDMEILTEGVGLYSLKSETDSGSRLVTLFGYDEVGVPEEFDLGNMSFGNVPKEVHFLLPEIAAEWVEDVDTYDFDEPAPISLHINRARSKFKDLVKVDGAEIRLDEDYSISEGSTVVNLSEEFLNSLEVGEHEIVVAFNTEEIASTFRVRNGSETPDPEDPTDPDDGQDGDKDDDKKDEEKDEETPNIPDTSGETDEEDKEDKNTDNNETTGNHGTMSREQSFVALSLMGTVIIASLVSGMILRGKKKTN